MNTLAGKLTIAIFILMFAGSVISGLMFYNYEKNISQKNLSSHAKFVSNLITASLHQYMLKAQSEDIDLTVKALGNTADVMEIIIFDSKGNVAFSSNSDKRVLDSSVVSSVNTVLSGELITPVITKQQNQSVLEHYSAIPNSPSCSTSACHYHPAQTKSLGALLTTYDVSSITSTGNQIFVGALLLGAFLVALISFCLFFVIYKFVTRPVAIIEQGMKRLAEGNFDEPIVLESNDEIGMLAQNFNSMSTEINNYKVRLESWAAELEKEVGKKTTEIKATQEQLVNAEKLASLGRLAAGVAHELNNPLTGVVTFAHLMLDRTPPENELDREDLETIIEQADRCTKIIKGLLSFSRKGTSEKTRININNLLQSSISIVMNQSAFHDINVTYDLSRDLPEVYVDSNQIQQVILNLFTNASDAMNGVGDIIIVTHTTQTNDGFFVEIAFSDTGPGIPADDMNKILEPFFTTKGVGKGTGLGLPVSYGIIKKHGGDILVQSKISKGATFLVRLPFAEEAEEAERLKVDKAKEIQ